MALYQQSTRYSLTQARPVDITALGSVGAICQEPRKLREILEDVQQLAAWQLSFSQT